MDKGLLEGENKKRNRDKNDNKKIFTNRPTNKIIYIETDIHTDRFTISTDK